MLLLVILLVLLIWYLATESFLPVFKPSVLEECPPSPAAPGVVYSFRYKTMRGCFNVAVVADKIVPAGYDFVLPDPPLGTPYRSGPDSWISPEYLKTRGWLLATAPINVYEAADIERLGSYRLLDKIEAESTSCVTAPWLI